MTPTSQKMYRCTRCGHESLHGTNHWGEIYPTCPKCSWKNPMQPQCVHVYLEPVPEGLGVPTPWKFVKLGDVCQVIPGL
jgi:DNA-directed RNA polymerase subunit RPC12/RpoP